MFYCKLQVNRPSTHHICISHQPSSGKTPHIQASSVMPFYTRIDELSQQPPDRYYSFVRDAILFKSGRKALTPRFKHEKKEWFFNRDKLLLNSKTLFVFSVLFRFRWMKYQRRRISASRIYSSLGFISRLGIQTQEVIENAAVRMFRFESME